MSTATYALSVIIGTFLECLTYGEYPVLSLWSRKHSGSYLIGWTGIFICLFVAACYVQWEKFSQGQGINRVMVSATVFFGITTTTVSENHRPRTPHQELTQ